MASSDPGVVRVAHLGGIDASYRFSRPYNALKPTVLLVNSFLTCAELYNPQFWDTRLNEEMNLLAVEPLGHGATRAIKTDSFTYWDTAIMNLQVLDALGLRGKVFVLGTSQGGWVATRMALIAPHKIAGIVLLGTSMDAETERSRKLGCWNGIKATAQQIKDTAVNGETPNWSITTEFCDQVVDSSLGKNVYDGDRNFWVRTIRGNYHGDEGRRRFRMATVNLRSRDGLHDRLVDIFCPVLWLHGTSDAVYSVANAEEEIKLFTNSPNARLQIVPNGQHFLSFSHPKEVNNALVDFVSKHRIHASTL